MKSRILRSESIGFSILCWKRQILISCDGYLPVFPMPIDIVSLCVFENYLGQYWVLGKFYSENLRVCDIFCNFVR